MASKHEGGILEHRTRYLILLLGWLCLTSIFSNTIALNFTFICMTGPASLNSSLTADPSVSSFPDHLDYGQTEKSSLLWALGVGTFIGLWPFNYLYIRYGARYIFFTAGMLSALSTAIIPIMAYIGLYWFIAARVIQGIAYGADFAAIGVITVRWASLKQSGVFIAVLTSFNSLSTMITNPVSGVLCESSLKWPAVYYSHAVFGVFIFAVWLFFYRDDPKKHKHVSAIELEKIHREKSPAHINNDKYIPYLHILRNKVIIVVWLNAFVEIVAGLFLLTYGPTYIKYVLKFSVETTGYLVALQGFLFLPLRIAAGFLSDRIKFLSEYRKVLLFNTVSLFGAGILYAVLGFLPVTWPLLSVIFAATAHAVMAFNVGGFYKCGTLVARQHSHFVISNIQFIKCLALFISPMMVAIFVKDDSSQAQWRIIFLILSVTLCTANVFFCAIATVKPAPFTTLAKPNKVHPEKPTIA